MVTQDPPVRWGQACDSVKAPKGVRCGAFLEEVDRFETNRDALEERNGLHAVVAKNRAVK